MIDWLKSVNPVNFSEFVRQVLYVGMAFEFLNWSDSQIAIVLSAISAGLSLITRSGTVANSRVEQKVAEQVAHREMIGVAGTGAGLPLPVANGKIGTGNGGGSDC